MSESNARIVINRLLQEAGWVFPGDEGKANVDTEVRNREGIADYLLKDRSDFPLCIVEAKNEQLSPLEGKEQARKYANSLNCRFAILSNGKSHYFWDIQHGSPEAVTAFPSQEHLELRQANFHPPRNNTEDIGADYIAQTQMPGFANYPEYQNENTRRAFAERHKLRFLRGYQLQALKAVQSRIAARKDRFLLEMATGTGKTLVAAAIIKMFLRLYEVKRVLFLMDRVELETQAQKAFDETLKNDFQTLIWKENRTDWNSAEIVVSTVQSFFEKYRKVFRPDHFGLVISDEAHRSVGGSLGSKSRQVFEYFIGFKLGLTATPKDYLKAGANDPHELERRMLRDTYTTFGCESGEPTFRYSLADGVRDGYLIQPKVLDARTGITTEMLSKQGYTFSGTDDDGNDFEEVFTYKDFERKFFSPNTNQIFCEAFFKHALRDPYTGEIGKTLVFCVSQSHAAKVAHILNVLADKIFPARYQSDFAVQVTSHVRDAQKMTTGFSNNELNGKAQVERRYLSAKTRVCVTVGMMTTGYDCADILNICMMRPVHSPSEFIQMKGRGTRKCDFSQTWMNGKVPPHLQHIEEREKTQFLLFDFFGNYEYFEKDFDYDEALKLPNAPYQSEEDATERPNIDGVESTAPDLLAELREISIAQEGMKIDRDFYRSFQKKVSADRAMAELVKQRNFAEAETYLKERVLDKPKEFFTMEKLRKALGLDRRLTATELLLFVFGQIAHIPSQRECLDEEFAKLREALQPDASVYAQAKEVFEACATDEDFRNIIGSRRYGELFGHPSGAAFRALPQELREEIPQYVQRHVNLERLKDVG